MAYDFWTIDAGVIYKIEESIASGALNGVIDKLKLKTVLNSNAVAGVVLQIVIYVTAVAHYLLCTLHWGTCLTVVNSTGNADVIVEVERGLARGARQNATDDGAPQTVWNFLFTCDAGAVKIVIRKVALHTRYFVVHAILSAILAVGEDR